MKNNIHDTATAMSVTNNIIWVLNQLTGRHFDPKAKTNINLIKYWLERGFDTSDFLIVIRLKYEEWSNVESMKKQIKPSVLFASHLFKNYRKQAQNLNK